MRRGDYSLQIDETHIWYGRAQVDHTVAVSCLSESERVRYQKFADVWHAQRYAVSVGAARSLLARYCGVAEKELVLGRRPCPRCGAQEHGPPNILTPAGEVEYSLSRSAGWWMLGVSRMPAIGVDVEHNVDLDLGVVQDALSPAERDYVNRQPTERARADAFYSCWTRKEALLKAAGVGIVADLKLLDMRPEKAARVEVRYPSGRFSTWCIEDVSLQEDLVAAVAGPAAHFPARLVIREFCEQV